MISRRGAVFVALFTLVALLSMQLNFSPIIGADNKSFHFFQFLGPVAGGFLGLWGIVVVSASQLINFMITGSAGPFSNQFLSLLPMVGAALYFGMSRKKGLCSGISLLIPLAAMLLFWASPGGAEAWYYALFWLIPLIAKLLPDKLFLKSLGATFTAHSIGSSMWAWFFPMSAEAWTALIPVTAAERLLFAAGIAVSYVLFTNILNAVDNVLDVGKLLSIDKRYVVPAFSRNKKED